MSRPVLEHASDPSPLPSQWLNRAVGSVAGPLVGLALVIAVFGAWYPDPFLTPGQFVNLARSTYPAIIAAVGATFVIISRGIDLSVGSNVALSCMVCAMFLRGFRLPDFAPGMGIAIGGGVGAIVAMCVVGNLLQAGKTLAAALWRGAIIGLLSAAPAFALWWLVAGRTLAPMPAPLAMLAGIVTGGIVGLINGVLVTQVSLPPFVATLATLGAMRGLTLYISETSVAARQLEPLHYLNWLPSAWIALAVVLIGAPLLHFTVLGRYTYAIGSNEKTARLCGVRVEFWKTTCYVIAGLCAGLAGSLATGKLSGASPTEFWGMELTVIAAVVLGGTSLFGGEGTIIGTVLGVLMLGLLESGCNVAEINPHVQRVFIGGVIALAAAIDRFRHLRG